MATFRELAGRDQKVARPLSEVRSHTPAAGDRDESVYWVVVFKWDPRKAAGNLNKHGIDFHEAATVLDDTLSTTFPDLDHSGVERRFVTVGLSGRRRLLVVVHAEGADTIRVISARRATRREQRFYEEG
ncbi:MAG: BrnT family toxin [Bryobacteraceae bacterium]